MKSFKQKWSNNFFLDTNSGAGIKTEKKTIPSDLYSLDSLSNAISFVNLGLGSYFSWGITFKTSISWAGSDRLASPNFTLILKWLSDLFIHLKGLFIIKYS